MSNLQDSAKGDGREMTDEQVRLFFVDEFASCEHLGWEHQEEDGDGDGKDQGRIPAKIERGGGCYSCGKPYRNSI